EATAARSRLELAGMRDQLDAAVAARAAAEADAERLVVELAATRTRLAEMERAVHKRAAGASVVGAKADAAEAQLAAVRAELADAVAARDAALADRAALHGGGVGDLERVRALLTEALMLTRATEPKARRRVRKPLAVPGGLYGHTAAAAEHLLRSADVVVLIDGYNVAKLGWPRLTLEQQRAACIEAAENMARRWGTLVHIVFDGASVVGANAERRRLVRVSYSPEGVLADDVLRAEVAALDSDRPVVVVTNDQAVLADVRAAGANTVASDTFLELARR
ncbi:MAG: NYN domain-containing protein, partial [Actinomycetota bacterium]|nr:NYN domain-containing protein [Actinomycetota bacterium]